MSKSTGYTHVGVIELRPSVVAYEGDLPEEVMLYKTEKSGHWVANTSGEQFRVKGRKFREDGSSVGRRGNIYWLNPDSIRPIGEKHETAEQRIFLIYEGSDPEKGFVFEGSFPHWENTFYSFPDGWSDAQKIYSMREYARLEGWTFREITWLPVPEEP